jgi:hypothetical protein
MPALTVIEKQLLTSVSWYTHHSPNVYYVQNLRLTL